MVGPVGDTRAVRVAVVVVVGLAIATALVGVLEHGAGVANASAVYLVAVVAAAATAGTVPALATALIAVIVYNLLFVEPRGTLAVGRAEDLLTLALLLFAGAVISRMAGLSRQRQQDAERREREARALFGMSREIVRSARLADALDGVVARLVAETSMRRVWVALGPTPASERIVADSAAALPRPAGRSHFVLRRDDAEGAVDWTRVHSPTGPDHVAGRSGRLFRIELRTGRETVGSLWAVRDDDRPSVEDTRLLAAAADQLGAAVARDRLQAGAAELEIARRSEELKSALLESASHDLRTPLAAIRAAAGTIADAGLQLDESARRQLALGIDEEADRMNRLVGDLLDMSRIQGGALVADVEIVPLEELVAPAVGRARRAGTAVELEIADGLPPVRADAALLDRVVSNLLDNAAKFAGDGARIRVAARAEEELVVLRVEDGGPGVPDEALGKIFERFVRGSGVASRQGFGLGLAVVSGLAEAMGARVSAGRSELGGLAIDISLPAAGGRSP